MALDFFESAMMNGLAQMPNEQFRERQQAVIDQRWEVTTNRYAVQEQKDIGSDEYSETEAWIGNAMGMTTRGMANGDDFKQLTFRSIDHKTVKGLYYKFDNNTWLTHFTDNNDAVDVTIGVRKCTNVMKIIDPENGSVFCIPCVVEYDMTAPNMQVTNATLTPSNHATVMVQGNNDTLRLFKTNTRYILGSRPFKLLGMQNAIVDKNVGPQDTLLYFDLFLDEIHAKDDIENQLADNGEYQYTVEIDSHGLEQSKGSVGSLEASVTLNGQEVNRKVAWSSSNEAVVVIDENGNYEIVGDNGESSIVTAALEGNSAVKSSIELKVQDAGEVKPKIIIEPSFDKIRQFESIKFEVKVSYNGNLFKANVLDVNSSDIMSIDKVEENYVAKGLKIGEGAMNVRVQDFRNEANAPDIRQSFPIKVVSMLG